MIRKHKIWIIAILLLILYSFNTYLGLLCFCIFFQTQLVIEIAKAIKGFKKTKNGIFADATLTNFRRIKGFEDDVHNYEAELEFSWPNELSKYQIKYKYSALHKPELSKKFIVWIDTNNPLESIVVSRFDIFWKLGVFYLVVVFIGLFFVDFMLLCRIILIFRLA